MINIICGHYGSGKTEFAINLALKKKKEGKNVTICDLDIVNPYFRTSDVKKFLAEKGINVVSSEFASSKVDIPVLPSEILSVFADDSIEAIFDVGGDDDGAVALGGFFNYIKNKKYKMFFVINAMRPMTANLCDICELAEKIEITSRIKITDIVNNTNLGRETDGDVVLKSVSYAETVSKLMEIPVVMTTVPTEILPQLQGKIKNLFPLELQKKL